MAEWGAAAFGSKILFIFIGGSFIAYYIMNFGALFGFDFDVPLWLIFIVGIIVAYYMYATWTFDTFKKMDIQGPAPIPLMGNMVQLIKQGIREWEMENSKKYGKIYGVFFARVPSLTITDTDILKQVLVKEFPHFINRQSKSFNRKESLFSLGLTVLQNDHWKHVRNSLSPTFSGGKLKLMQRQILKCADQLVEHVRKAERGEGFEFKELSDSFSMDVIAFTTYGIELDSFKDPDNIFVRMSKKILDISLKDPRVLILFFFPFLANRILTLFPIISKETDNFFLKVTHDVLEDRKRGVSKKQKDFVQIMADALTEQPIEQDVDNETVYKDELGIIWNNTGLTEREIAANSLLYLVAGFENNSATLGLVVHCLTINPEVQDTLIAEIDSKLNGKEPSYDDISELTYLHQVIEETMRIYPLAPRLERAVEKDITINGMHFPKGIQVGVPVLVLHMDPDVWPEPEKFDPDRFSEEAKADRDPYYYMPFGMGPRNCIGMRLALLEIKIALVRLLQNFTFVPCAKTEVPLKLKKLKMSPENGIFLTAKPR